MAALRKAAGQGITEGWCAWIAKRFTAAGWTARDLAWAVDYEPGGAQHRLSARVRHVTGWLRWRLGRWIRPDGSVHPSRSQQLAASRERARADRARLAELTGALAAGLALPEDSAAPDPGAWTDPAPHAAAIRERLGWHSEPEAKTMRWVQYPTDAHRKRTRRGQPRRGDKWSDGPRAGTVWAVPMDTSEQLFVLVHYFPGQPGKNYALDTEQGTPATPTAKESTA